MGSGPGPQYTIIPNDWANLEYVINDLSRIINTDSGFADFVPYTGAVGNVDLGAHSLTGSRGIFTEPTLSPFTITSNVVNTNLNADLLDGQHGSYYQVAGNYQPLATNLTSLSGLTYASTSFVKMTSAGTFGLDTATYLTAEADTLSTVMTRGATTALQLTSTYPTASGSPFAITSTTVNTNLNAELWGGYKFSDYLNQSVKQAATPTFANLTLTDHLKIDDTLYNTLVGYGTYFSNTTGHDNTFVGYKTGYKNTEGWANTFLGLYAGYSNTTGCKNTFMGYYAGWYNTTGLGNTFLGEHAGNTNTTGNDNTFLGQESGYKNTEGYDNVFVGLHTGHENTTGYENTALGKKAGYSNTTGNENVFLGKKAGFYETGSKKLFIDNDSRTNEADGRAKALIYGIFAAATANQYLTVNGHFTALEDITDSGLTASQAVMTDANKKLVSVDYLDQSVKQAASPTFAGLTITNKLKFDDVYYNTFFGTNAGQLHTTGIFDTYVGYDVGTHGTIDYYNTGIGHAVLHNITIGHDNFGGGVYALLGLTEGVGDIGLGSSAGAGLTTGSNNLLIGTGSGQTLTVENNNVMIGPYSGLITASSSNVFIGNMSGRRQTTLGNRLIIDNQDRTSAALEITNSLIYGVFDATPANQTLRVNAAITIPYALGAGAITGTSFIIGANTISSFANLSSLSGLTFASTSFVKMTSAGTFGLDTNTYLTTTGTAADSDKWDGYQFSDFIDQSLKTTSSPIFKDIYLLWSTIPSVVSSFDNADGSLMDFGSNYYYRLGYDLNHNSAWSRLDARNGYENALQGVYFYGRAGLTYRGSYELAILVTGFNTTTGIINLYNNQQGLQIEKSTGKLGLWGATPAVQQAHIVDADITTVVAQFNALLLKLETIGILSAS